MDATWTVDGTVLTLEDGQRVPLDDVRVKNPAMDKAEWLANRCQHSTGGNYPRLEPKPNPNYVGSAP